MQDKALPEAADGGKASEVERLLKEGADPDAKNGGGSPALYLATAGGHLGALLSLIHI